MSFDFEGPPLAIRVLIATLFCLLAGSSVSRAETPSTSLIERMAANEIAAHQQHVHFGYIAEERSARTSGHLWREKVIETADGPLHHLLAIDGKPLDAAQAKAEAARIAAILRNPSALRQASLAHSDDQSHATQLLKLLPKAFVLTPAGEQNGCIRFNFAPNPAFQPSSYEERVAHAMKGTVSLKQPVNRLCTLDATIQQPVEFGFGLLGRIEQGGHFSLERVQVQNAFWKSDHISVHMQGRILLLKTLTREQEVRRSSITVVPQQLTLQQALQFHLP